MARIKFLDVLEETKQKPAFRSEERFESPEPREQRPEMRESFRDFRGEAPVREYRTPSALPRDSRSQAFTPRRSFEKEIDKEETVNTKLIWIAALVLFLAALFFFGGYWAARLQQKMAAPDAEYAAMPAPIPAPLIMDTAALPPAEPALAPKPIPVVQPLVAAPVKKAAVKAKAAPKTVVGNGEYVVQVAAFTQLDKAREYEKKLSEAFEGSANVYISENYMGTDNEKKIFRVRVRNGFRTEAEAKKVLSTVSKALNIPDTDPRIVKLD